METSSIREEARFHLQGRWGMAILVTFLASVLGGLILNGGSANFDFDESVLIKGADYFQRLVEELP